MFQKHASREITYARQERTFALQATVGRTTFQLQSESGVLAELESRDYLVLWSALLAQLGDEPRPGDRIEDAGPEPMTTVYVYEVMSPGDGPCWRFCDSARELIRMHTKLREKR